MTADPFAAAIYHMEADELREGLVLVMPAVADDEERAARHIVGLGLGLSRARMPEELGELLDGLTSAHFGNATLRRLHRELAAGHVPDGRLARCLWPFAPAAARMIFNRPLWRLRRQQIEFYACRRVMLLRLTRASTLDDLRRVAP